MALSQAQLNRRRQRKNKVRAEKVRAVLQQSQITNLANWPVVGAHAPVEASGTLQHVVLLRQCPNGKLAVSFFLIDLLCLGVKDCFLRIVHPEQFGILLDSLDDVLEMQAVSPSYVATFVQKAVSYARSIGFNPGGDYRKVSQSLEGIPLDPDLQFTFGQDGKPFYIQGPRDSQHFVGIVLKTLETLGKRNYDFALAVGHTGHRANDALEGVFEGEWSEQPAIGRRLF